MSDDEFFEMKLKQSERGVKLLSLILLGVFILLWILS